MGALLDPWGGADDLEGHTLINVFLHVLQQLGWSDGRNMRIDARWAVDNADNLHKFAAELTALAPDVIFAPGGPVLGSMLQATHRLRRMKRSSMAGFELKAVLSRIGLSSSRWCQRKSGYKCGAG